MHRVAAAALIALLLPGPARAQHSIVGSYAVTFATGTVKAVPAPVAAQLAGEWVVRFTSEGRYEVLQNGRTHVTGTFVESGTRLTLHDESGDLACVGSGRDGIYRVVHSGNSLTFVRVKDSACPGRVMALTTKPFHLEK
jgi:hypothetical protein